MRGKSMKRRLCRVFRDRNAQGEWVWYRQYYNPRTQKKEVNVSPCQNGLNLK